MPSWFGKKPSSSIDKRLDTPPRSPTKENHGLPFSSPPTSPSGKGKGYFVREQEGTRSNLSGKGKDSSRRPTTRRRSRTRTSHSQEHPLNLPPEQRDLQRVRAAFAAGMMDGESSPVEQNGDVHAGEGMESTPVPEEKEQQQQQEQEQEPTAVNGDGEQSTAPTPPLHRTPTTQSEAPKEVVDPEACKAAGNKFYKAAQYKQAIEEYTKAIEASPSTSTYLSNRAAAYMAANRYAEALEDCKSADELEPNNTKVLHRLAKVYTALGRSQEALDVYGRIDPPATAKDKAPALNMAHHISQAQDSLQSSTSGSMVLHAIDQAEKGLGYAVTPPRKWRLMRGEAYLKMGSVNSLGDAQNIAMSLLRNNSADPEALVLRGRALYAQGDNEKAITHFRKALECDPDFKDAVKYLRMVQKLDRMKEQGNDHFKHARYQPAVEIYTSALEVDPLNKGTNSKILNNRAMCHTRLKQYDQAIKDCDQAIQLDPSYTKARKTRAKALGESGDWEEAVRALKAIQEQSPEEPGIAKEIRNAELEVKKSKRKDYYKILDIEKHASDHEIKRAYRKLAVKHHPDKNPDDPEAEGRFKDLQEAHETLSDPEKRERYDSGADLMDPMEGFGGGGFGHGFGGGGFGGGGGVQIDPEMLFNMMGGGGGGRGGGFSYGGMPQRGGGGFPFG